MKILFDHFSPFLLSHGGFQIQIEQTLAALRETGVEAEPLRWWDDRQRGDIVHYFGRPRLEYVRFAQGRGMKVVMTHLLTGLGSRAAWKRRLQKLVVRTGEAVLPAFVTAPFGWAAYRLVDAAIMLTPWEAHLMRDMFRVPSEKVRVVSNGVEAVFFNSRPAPRGPWLVCTATITERKRIVELALTAVAAETPLRVIGRAYDESDPYFQRFRQIAREHPKLVSYEGAAPDRPTLATAYREARGFVLLSSEESLSLSALEAAACECPLLLSDLPWARTVFGKDAVFCPVTSNVAPAAASLRKFYAVAPSLPPPPKPLTWLQVAGQLKAVYAGLLQSPRPLDSPR